MSRGIAKSLLRAFIGLGILMGGLCLWLWPRYDYAPAAPLRFRAEHISESTLIEVGMSERLARLAEQEGYANINGPSVIRVPDWVENPLGRYYLYFSHHKGAFIRFAYADSIEGPWTVHEPGSLSLAGSLFPETKGERGPLLETLGRLSRHFSVHVMRDMLILGHRARDRDPAIRRERGMAPAQNAKPHIASPEVVIDDDRREILMYYHGLTAYGAQWSRVAVSHDGIRFEPLPDLIPSNYLRAFAFRGEHFLIGMPGVL